MLEILPLSLLFFMTSADFGDVTRKPPENQALLKIKISDEQKIGRDLTDPS